MRLVEQHLIRRGDPRYPALDAAAFASKNLWNAANYLVRQAFLHDGVYLSYVDVFHQIKSHEAYQALPRKVSNQVHRLVGTEHGFRRVNALQKRTAIDEDDVTKEAR
jgi:putative transposase